MKNMFYCFLCNLLLVILVILTSCSRHDDVLAIVPEPVFIEQVAGEFVMSDDIRISVEDEPQRLVAELFAELFSSSAGFTPEVVENSGDAEIKLFSDPELAPEAYRVFVRRDGVDIQASSPKGFFYAFQTLRLALPPEIESDSFVPGIKWSIPAMMVYDAPRFGYRGLMVDVSRYFLPKENLLEIIDCMAMLKLNNLHLHLTDDNGWRIEIKKYPTLTSIGAWRADRGDTPFPDRKNPVKGEPTPIGGFYTQEDIRDIVAYAAQRQVNVIPEIDMPAHSNSALAAFPQFACPVVDRYIGVLPGLGGGNADIIYCAGNDDVFEFLKDVIDEVCELFPSEYIHLGGDEAWKTYWRKCPRCQQRILAEGLADEEALQGWFMAQMNDYLLSKGRTMIGWDELTNSRIPEDAVVFGWREDGTAALKAAQQGHRFVMTPAELFYLIRYQGPQWFEPLTYFGNSTLKDVYSYEPVKDNWTDECIELFMGVQGSMWTEFCSSPEDVTYQIFPRAAALAEVAWSPAGTKDWKRFIRGVDVYDRHMEAKGIEYSKSMYNIQHKVLPMEDGQLAVNLTCERPDVQIRYTIDGSEPAVNSMKLIGNIKVRGPVTIKAATFGADGAQMGQTIVLPIVWCKSTACQTKGKYADLARLVNGVRGSLRQTDFEWCHFAGKSDMIIDLGQQENISKVTVGTLTNNGMAFHKPAEMSVWLSKDGKEYRKVETMNWTADEIFAEGNFKEDVVFAFEPVSVRFVKVSSDGPGVCPDGHIRERQRSKYCFDEIMID